STLCAVRLGKALLRLRWRRRQPCRRRLARRRHRRHGSADRDGARPLKGAAPGGADVAKRRKRRRRRRACQHPAEGSETSPWSSAHDAAPPLPRGLPAGAERVTPRVAGCRHRRLRPFWSLRPIVKTVRDNTVS
ncbi:unnamed protein product, partial [Phaeothamnion confervicola]